ncbi:hypothetical protein HDU86_007231 [Geranomyces michiganensis]|nr:hypothetical protein HDU86_007231 [Geranomyces michiganensis]
MEAGDDLFTRLQLKVGRILAVEQHPTADKLFVETIDIGSTTEPVTIVSGLRPYYAADELKNCNVIVVVNMKPSNFRGVRSAGMLLAAYRDECVEVLEPPAGSAPGDLVFIGERPKGQQTPWIQVI